MTHPKGKSEEGSRADGRNVDSLRGSSDRLGRKTDLAANRLQLSQSESVGGRFARVDRFGQLGSRAEDRRDLSFGISPFAHAER